MLTATDLDVSTYNKAGGLEECLSLLEKLSYWPECGGFASNAVRKQHNVDLNGTFS